MRHDQEDDPQDHEADLAGEDHSPKEDRVERRGDRGLTDSESGRPRVRHDVREESRDLNGGDDGFGQGEKGAEDGDEGDERELHAHETAQAEGLDYPRKPSQRHVPDPSGDGVPSEGEGEERKEPEKAQEPAELRERVFLVVTDLVHEPDDVRGTKVHFSEQDGKIDHVGNAERRVNDGLDRNRDTEGLETQLFQMGRRRVERDTKALAENYTAEEERPDAPECGDS